MATSPRARGADFKLYAKTESTAGTAPTGDWLQLPCISFGLGAQANIRDDAILSAIAESTRDQVGGYLDLTQVEGPAVVPVDLENFGTWLRLFMGAPSTSGSSDYTHVFTSGAVSLPSIATEKAFSRISKFAVCTYVSGNTMEITWDAEGRLVANLDLMAQDETIGGTTSAGTPTFAGMTRFRRGHMVLLKGGSAFANVTSFRMRLENNLEAIRTVNSAGAIEAIDAGNAGLSGSFRIRVADTALITAAEAETTQALAPKLTISATKALEFDLPRCLISRPKFVVEGPGGIEFDVNFRAEYDLTSGYMMQATLKNQTAAYS